MSVQVALLRGINVAGHNSVAMALLRELVSDLGLANAKTLLQSGNLVFESDARAGAALERLLELETAKRLKVTADYIVRSAAEWQQIVRRNPFPSEAKTDPSHLVVMFMKKAPLSAKVKELQAAIRGPEILHHDRTQLYIVYPDGIGRSKLTSSSIEQRLGVRGTARNWNTVLKLLALCK